MNTRIAAAGLVILALAAGGFAIYVTMHHPGGTITAPPSISNNANPPSNNGNTSTPGPKEATVYTVDEAHGDDNALAPVKVSLSDPRSPAKSAVQALIETNNSPIPSGTRLLGIKIDGGTASVNFSSEFKKNFHGGDEQEAQAVDSVLMTLGQFHTVDRVQFLVEGNSSDTLGGHADLSAPLDVVRPTHEAKAE